MLKILRVKIFQDFFVYFILIFFGFLFFYKLGTHTLASWDEAWYGSIAREILNSGELMFLQFNGAPFYDHPPMGMWLIAVSYKIFGVSEFSTRFPSALLGLFSMYLIFAVGTYFSKEKIVGLASSIILGTSVWYVIRVRSGNLDSIFIFFYLLTVYFAIKAQKDMKWFVFTMLSFGALLLSKTIIGLSIFPIIVLLVLPKLLDYKKNMIYILLGFVFFALMVVPWYIIQYKSYSDFMALHFFKIGMRNKTLASYLNLDFQLPLFYLHMGIRKWYYLWLFAFAYLLIFFRFFRRNIFILAIWNVIILYPFLTSNQTQIWHLIPVYVPVALITALGFWNGGITAISFISRISFFNKYLKAIFNIKLIKLVYILVFIYIATIQIRIFYKEVMPGSRYIPDDVDISLKSKKYSQLIFLDDDFLPLAVFYSGRNMRQIEYENENKTLEMVFRNEGSQFVAITRNWALTNLDDNKLKYKILANNNSFSIVTKIK